MDAKFDIKEARRRGIPEEVIQAHLNDLSSKGYNVQAEGFTPTSTTTQNTTINPETGSPEEYSYIGSLGKNLVDYMPTIGQTVGGIGGFMLGGPVGGVIGAGAGGALGETGRQFSKKEDADIGKILKEGTVGAGLEALGLGVGAVAKPILKSIGKGALPAIAENLSVKGWRLKPGFLTKFAEDMGEDVSSVAMRHNAIGRSAEDLAETVINPLQKQFDNVVMKSKINIPLSSMDDKVISYADELMKGGDSSQMKLGEDLVNEWIGYRTRRLPGASADIADVTKLRKYFDKLTRPSEFNANPTQWGMRRVLGDITRQTINESAEQAGARVGDMSLKTTGMELKKLYRLVDGITAQENLGRGSLPFGLTKLLALNVAGTTSPQGILGRLATEALVNSPRAVRTTAKGSMIAGKAIAGLADRLPSFTGQGLSTYMQLGRQPQKDVNKSVLPELNMQGIGNQDITDTPPVTPQEVLDELARIATIKSAAGQESALKLLKLRYPAWAAQAKGQVTGYTSGQEKELSDIKVAQSLLTDLDREVSEMGVSGPILGRLSSINPYSATAQKYNARLKVTKQIIGKALEGGVLRKEDEVKYAYILPQINDTAEVAQYKSDQLKKLIKQQLQIKTSIYGGGSVLPEVNLAQ